MWITNFYSARNDAIFKTMDLLSQYKQDHPEAFREQKQAPMADEYGRAYTGMTAWVMRMSGGRIRDARGASYMLFAVAAVLLAASLIFFFAGSGSSIAPPPPTPFQSEGR